MNGDVGYQALARKYRPENFDELSGQGEVVAALKNSLSSGKIHHAYLLSGTRGSGKTTVARIMAKALECEAGNPAEPCCACETCKSIAAGDFIDVTEIDAASRTGIEDMRELIENVMYKPVKGKYKIFIIDEVHMLSLSSFNALLKTLEEPPEHVKFILATTDPQKLPVTVLSRCVHFRFLPLPSELVKERLAYVLEREGVTHDGDSLELIASKSGGSMRDALSITDQMVSLCAGNLTKNKVADALGCLDDAIVSELAAAACLNDAARAMAAMDKIKSLNPGYKSVLDALIASIHATVMARALGRAGRAADIYKSADGMDSVPDSILHLAYQILINAKRDFDLAPSNELAFEMAVMRLLAYAAIAWTEEIKTGAASSDEAVKKNFSDPVRAPQIPNAAIPAHISNQTTAVSESEPKSVAPANAAPAVPISSAALQNSAAAPSVSGAPLSANMSQPASGAQTKTNANPEPADIELLNQLLSMGRVERAPEIPGQDVSDEPPASNWKPGPSSVFGKQRIGGDSEPSEQNSQPSDEIAKNESSGGAGRGATNAASVQSAPEKISDAAQTAENAASSSGNGVPSSGGAMASRAPVDASDALKGSGISSEQNLSADAQNFFAAPKKDPSQDFSGQGLPNAGQIFSNGNFSSLPANSEQSLNGSMSGFAGSQQPAAYAPPKNEASASSVAQHQPAAPNDQISGQEMHEREQGHQTSESMVRNAASPAPKGFARFDSRREYLETDTMPRVAEKDPWTDAIMKMDLSDMTKTMLIGTSCDLSTGAVLAPADFAYLLTEDVLNEVRQQYAKIVPEGTAVPKFVLIPGDAAPSGTPSELMRQYYDKLCRQQFDKFQSDEHFQDLVKRFGCSVGISNIHLLKG